MKIYNKLFLTIAIAFLMFVCKAAKAQRTIDIKSTFHDEINATHAVKKTFTYNLKGTVKCMKEFTPSTPDTSFYEFNPNGFLIRYQTGGSYISGISKTITTYLFENDRLKKIKIKIPFYGRTGEKIFNATGYLEKEINDWVDYEEKFHQEAIYTYTNYHKEVIVNYKYKNQSDTWDVVRQDKYTFTFDNKKRLTKVRKISKHDESDYGSSTVISYDSLSYRPNAILHTDDCAGSNSCLNLDMSVRYDKRGNIIMESLTDRTIRNSTWSYSYLFKAKYNERNEIIEEYRSSGNDKIQFQFADIKPDIYDAEYEKNKTIYQYEYDAKGNWIKKYSINNNKRMLKTQRMIVYFE